MRIECQLRRDFLGFWQLRLELFFRRYLPAVKHSVLDKPSFSSMIFGCLEMPLKHEIFLLQTECFLTTGLIRFLEQCVFYEIIDYYLKNILQPLCFPFIWFCSKPWMFAMNILGLDWKTIAWHPWHTWGWTRVTNLWLLTSEALLLLGVSKVGLWI
jgi:hypothetical protein